MYSHSDNTQIINKLYTRESLKNEYAQDIAFLERIKNQVTINGQLPFNVPIDNIPEIIYNASEWFFRHCEDASEEKWLIIPVSALNRDNNFNSTIKLPFRIISVNEIKAIGCNGAFSTMPYSFNTAFRYETMFMTASQYSNLNTGGYAINSINSLYSNRFYDGVADSMLAIFAQGDIQSIFGKNYRFKYNRNSRNLNFLTDIPTNNFAINVTERLLLQDLYDDDRFIKYIVGHVLVNINFVLSVFGFNMPGNINIDASVYIDRGRALIDEVTKDIEDDDDSPIIIMS